MIASPTLRRLMSRLALAAALLMVVAPTISRTLSAPDAMAAGMSMRAAPMCVDGHLQAAPVALADAGMPADPGRHPDMPGPHPDGAACGYCTLVAPQQGFVALSIAAQAFIAAAPFRQPRIVRVRTARNLRSLGSQAPPEVS